MLTRDEIVAVRIVAMDQSRKRMNRTMTANLEKDEVWYNLPVIGDVTIDDEKYKGILWETLRRLPEEVREKILNEVIFVFTSTYGTTTKLFVASKEQQREQKYIILNPALQAIERRTDEGITDVIAHECAHIVLNRFGSSDPEFEKEADDLIETWGFKRAYKDYTRFMFMREKKWL